jgi:hypothetical protein
MNRKNVIKIELEKETDGRWIAEIPAIPGALVYGNSPKAAEDSVKRLCQQIDDSTGHVRPAIFVTSVKSV